MNSTVKEIYNALMGFDSITLLSHIRPDGDTLGSAFALCYALRQVGKKAKVVCADPITERYDFLSGGVHDIANECDGNIVCVDIAAPDMAGAKYAGIAENADIVIDHHATNRGYGKLNLIDADAAACGEIVLEIVRLICPIDKRIAECLYTAVSTDTGCFVYANTTAKTHIAAAELMAAGADAAALNKLLFRTKSKTAFDIERATLSTLEYYYDNRIACMKIPLEQIVSLSATEDDMEGLSSVPACIEGIEAAATFRETEPDVYKVSVRTNGSIDGGAVCKALDGGGHKMAAGCTLSGDYAEVSKMLAERLYNSRG